MKKEWNMPILDELNISLTANGQVQNENHDGPWQQLPTDPPTWWRPGASR